VFPEIEAGAAVGYEHIADAIAEFQFTLIRADAPLDRYARGDLDALTVRQKEAAILFYDRRSSCFECHITIGYANQMFSDFDSHVLAVPQVTPLETNADFDGPGDNEDFGLERVSGDERDRYKFRTTPLRNAAYQPTFMHNGAFVCMEEAIRHHVRMYESLEQYNTSRLEPAMRGPLGPTAPMVERAHKLSKEPREILSDDEIASLADFVRNALADPDAAPDALRGLVPTSLPSGLPVHDFDFTVRPGSCS
jgi:cytochrome c peroxidase